ncbi:MAG: hypothetical protein ABI706_13975 [Ilumatobacteraceae bacterium]
MKFRTTLIQHGKTATGFEVSAGVEIDVVPESCGRGTDRGFCLAVAAGVAAVASASIGDPPV